jgi:hypothetical protein
VPVRESRVGDSGCVLDTVDDLARLYESQYLPMLRVSAARLDGHEGDTIREHVFVCVVSPSCPSAVVWWSAWWREVIIRSSPR